MTLQVVNNPLSFQLYGFPGTAIKKKYAETAFKLSERTWKTVRMNGLKNKRINIWVYGPGENVFAGIELEESPGKATGLQQENFHLINYAYYQHVGPYKLLQQVGIEMRKELVRQGFEIIFPYVERYGHWQIDEANLETELFICLR